MQFLSEKISRFLSSLAPGFEGHYFYVDVREIFIPDTNFPDTYTEKHAIYCREKIQKNWEIFKEDWERVKVICPAWQVEDVLRNLQTIEKNTKDHDPEFLKKFHPIAEYIAYQLVLRPPNTAYQKIEEYLLTVLK